MALTVGTGPFGHRPGGVFNREMPEHKGLIYFEDFQKRMRATLAGETVVDSRHAKLLHEHGHLPILYFPVEEVREELLEATDHSTRCPWKGEASYWSVRVGDRVAENAMWGYPDPIQGAPPLADYRALYWNSMDGWLEEDEEAIVHVRDPYHRVDVLDTSRHVRISLHGETLAESTRARVIYETGLPPRWYFPPEDVQLEHLAESELTTGCAYKGFASYWSARAGDDEGQDLAWTYRDPRPEAARIQGYIAFFNERADIELDGEMQERPLTQWSPGWRGHAPRADVAR
ncbi:MAG: hypothetical protein QOI98_351 [Solirubrobacteraceae bacterium]|nr:hypothetical protein [Solirubrobacteraceae bacterium]